MNQNAYSHVQETGFYKAVLPGLLKAFLWAPVVTAALFLIAALLLTYTGLSESAMPLIVIVSSVLSVALAGAAAARVRGRRGCLNGALMGLSYTLFLYLLSVIVAGRFTGGPYLLALVAIGLFAGAFGGIVGINMQK